MQLSLVLAVAVTASADRRKTVVNYTTLNSVHITPKTFNPSLCYRKQMRDGTA